MKSLHEGVEPLNGDTQLLDRDAMWRNKMRALWAIFKAGRSAARQAQFEAYKASCGEELEAYATWCLCYDKWGAPNGQPDNWEKTYTKNSPEITALRGQYPDTLDFYRPSACTRPARTCGGTPSASPREPPSARRRTCSTSRGRTGASRR